MFSLLYQGGPIIGLLLLCSMTGVYIVTHKLFFFKTHFNNLSLFLNDTKDRLISAGINETLLHLQPNPTIASNVLSSAIKLNNQSRDTIQDGIRESIYNQIPKIEYMMPFLSSIITVAPILGLTGTVLGLMEIFNVISGGSIGDAQALSAGIATALITTVTGLLITIPFIFFHQYFSQKIDHYILELERMSYDIITFCNSNDIIKK